MVTVAICLDYIIATITEQMHIDPPKMAVIGLLVTAWFLLNEMLSVIENAGRMGADVPDWLIRYIAVLKRKIDDTADGEKNAE